MKMLGVVNTGQPVQMTNGTITTFGNPIGNGFDSFNGNKYADINLLVAFPNYVEGRIQLFAFIGGKGTISSTLAPVYTSYDGLVKLPITYTSGSFTKGATVTGSLSGATGTIAETYTDRFSGSPTELYVDDISSGPFVNGDVLSGAGVATVNGTPSTDSMGDAWKIDVRVSGGNGIYQSTGVKACYGFNPINLGGSSVVLSLLTYGPASNLCHAHYYDPATDTWYVNQASYGTDDEHPGATVFDTKLCQPWYTGTSGILAYDFSSGSFASSVIGGLTSGAGMVNIGIAGGSLYALTGSNASTLTRVFKYNGSAFVQLGTITLSSAAYYQDRGRIFESPDGEIIIIWPSWTMQAWRILSESPWTVEEITGSLPSSLDYRDVYPVIDRLTNGSTGAPIVQLVLQRSDGAGTGAISVWKCEAYNNWTDLGSNTSGYTTFFGHNWTGAFPSIYEPGANLGILTGAATPVPGGQRFTYRVFGSGSVNVELLVQEDVFAGSGAVRGTLGSPSQGTLTDGNKKITGVSADGNEKTAVWLGSSDGFTDGDFVYRLPYIST